MQEQGPNPAHDLPQPRGLELAYSAFILVAVGRVGELIPGLSTLPLARIAMGIGILILVVRWRQLPKVAPVSRPLLRVGLALGALAVVTAPFSIWPGASFGFLYQQLPVLAAVLIVGTKLPCAWPDVRRLARILIIAGVALALAALAGFHGGRAQSATGTYDPNDLAYLLVSVMPLSLAFVISARSKAARLMNVGVLGTVVVALLLTSSRGGFFGLLAVLLFVVFAQIRPRDEKGNGNTARARVLPALLGVSLLSLLIWPYLPQETRARLETVVSLGSDYNMDVSNEESRSSIWKRNLLAAIQRPIGYGVDSFPMVDIRTGGKFKAPHNSYLQALVELGFLGLFLFLRVYWLSWRALKEARRLLLLSPRSPERSQAVVFSRMLQASLVGNAVAGFFLSMAYSTVLWTLVAVVAGFSSVISSQVPASSIRK